MPTNQTWRKAAEATFVRIVGLMFNRLDAHSVAVPVGANFTSLHMHEPCMQQTLETVGEYTCISYNLS